MRVFGRRFFLIAIHPGLALLSFCQPALAEPSETGAPTIAQPAADPVLGRFLDSFSDEDYLRQMPQSGPAPFAGVMAEDVRSYVFSSRLPSSTYLNRPSRVYGVWIISFKNDSATIRAANAYLDEADPARGHALKWEIGIPRGKRLYLLHGGTGVTRREWNATSERFLEALEARTAPRMVCRDVGGCWIEGL